MSAGSTFHPPFINLRRSEIGGAPPTRTGSLGVGVTKVHT